MYVQYSIFAFIFELNVFQIDTKLDYTEQEHRPYRGVSMWYTSELQISQNQ